MSRSHNMVEARDSVDRLHGIIEQFYKEMSTRVEIMERLNQPSEDETSSITTVKAPSASSTMFEVSSMPSNDIATFDFTETLQKSRVYRRNHALDSSRLSVFSRDSCSMTWSCLSGVSLAEASNVSVIGLPITMDEVHNPLQISQTWSNNYVNSFWLSAPTLKITPQRQAVSGPQELTSAWTNDVKVLIAAESSRAGCGEALKNCTVGSCQILTWSDENCRCNTCSKLLGPNANDQLFFDGSISYSRCICSCDACGNKIEDLARLNCDQASCQRCCKCYDCVLKAEHSKFARTTQGKWFAIKVRPNDGDWGTPGRR